MALPPHEAQHDYDGFLRGGSAMKENGTHLFCSAAMNLASGVFLAALLCLQTVGGGARFWATTRRPGRNKILITSALAATPGQCIASGSTSLLVGSIALGIAGVLIIQALISVSLVIQKKYSTRDPSHFIATAVAFLLIGTITVLSEVTVLAFRDVIGLLALMYIPAAIAIFPPLLQRLKTEKTSGKKSATAEKRTAKRVAVTLSLLAFGFMSAVSLVVFVTEERSGVVDSLLLVSAPFILAALAYFVGLWHKPEASD